MGRGALHRKAAQKIKLRPDVDARKIKQWKDASIRLWLGFERSPWSPHHRTRRRLARLRVIYRPLRRRQTDSHIIRQSYRSQTWENRAWRCRDLQPGACASADQGDRG